MATSTPRSDEVPPPVVSEGEEVAETERLAKLCEERAADRERTVAERSAANFTLTYNGEDVLIGYRREAADYRRIADIVRRSAARGDAHEALERIANAARLSAPQMLNADVDECVAVIESALGAETTEAVGWRTMDSAPEGEAVICWVPGWETPQGPVTLARGKWWGAEGAMGGWFRPTHWMRPVEIAPPVTSAPASRSPVTVIRIESPFPLPRAATSEESPR